jgi:hypothetical protein
MRIRGSIGRRRLREVAGGRVGTSFAPGGVQLGAHHPNRGRGADAELDGVSANGDDLDGHATAGNDDQFPRPATEHEHGDSSLIRSSAPDPSGRATGDRSGPHPDTGGPIAVDYGGWKKKVALALQARATPEMARG